MNNYENETRASTLRSGLAGRYDNQSILRDAALQQAAYNEDFHTPKRCSEIQERLEGLEKQAENLIYGISKLQERLAPVCRPMATSGSNKAEAAPCSTPMGAALERLSNRLSSVLEAITDLSTAVDL